MQSQLLFLLITTLIPLVICADFDFKNSFEKRLLTFKKENQKRNVEQTGICSSNCTIDGNCYIFFGSRFCQNGQCVPILSDGSVCDRDSQCFGYCINNKCGYKLISGCFCSNSSDCDNGNCQGGICTNYPINPLPGNPGFACTSNSTCKSNFCIFFPSFDYGGCSGFPDGTSCNSTTDCLKNSFCNFTNLNNPINGICIPKSGLGGSCQLFSNCLDDLFCNSTTRTCQVLPVLNQNCPNLFCDPLQNLYCSNTNGTGICLTKKPIDSSCILNSECVSGKCENNKCWDYNTKDLGQNCFYSPSFLSNDCKNSYACINGICSKVPSGSPCLNSTQCSGQSCNCFNSSLNTFTCNGGSQDLFTPQNCLKTYLDSYICLLSCSSALNCSNCLVSSVNFICDCYCPNLNSFTSNDVNFPYLAATGNCENRNSIQFLNNNDQCSFTRNKWTSIKQLCSSGVLTSTLTGAPSFGLKNFEINFNLLIIILSIFSFFGFLF